MPLYGNTRVRCSFTPLEPIHILKPDVILPVGIGYRLLSETYGVMRIEFRGPGDTSIDVGIQQATDAINALNNPARCRVEPLPAPAPGIRLSVT